MPETAPGLKRTEDHTVRWLVTLSGTYAFSLAIAFFWSYLPRWYVSLGWTSSAVGLLFAVATLLRSLAMPLWARAAEVYGAVGRVLRWAATIGAVALWWLPFASDVFPAYVALIAVYVSWNAFLPLVDALTVRELGAASFGRVRAWGSAAYGLAALGVAFFGAQHTHAEVAAWAPWSIAVLGTLGLSFVWGYPKAELTIKSPALPDALRLLRRPALYVLLPLWSLHWAAQSPFNLFLVFLCEERGMDGWVPGVAVAFGIAAEVAALAWGRAAVDRLGPERLFALCAAATCVRWFGSATAQSEALLVGLQVLHGLTFGGYLLAMMAVLDREIRPEVRNTGQALMYVLVFGLGSGIGNAAAGFLEDAHGAASAFIVAGWVELGITAAAVAYAWRRAKV